MNHQWKITTVLPMDNERVVHWKCKKCGTKVRKISYTVFNNSLPNSWDLERDIRALTCEEVIVKQVHEA
jgi:hypothetical protein